MTRDTKAPGNTRAPGDGTAAGDTTPAGTSMRRATNAANDNRVAQRHQKQSQAAQLGAANVEESPHMDRGDSAQGTGESLGHGREAPPAPPRRGAVDTQYGTKSSLKSGSPPAADAPADAGAEASKGGDRPPAAPDPGSSEASSGPERDTMTTSRPGRGS